MAIKFSSGFFSLKLLIFRVVKTYFSAPDHTIFVKKIVKKIWGAVTTF